jgi:preprotein translocase subunit YajC
VEKDNTNKKKDDFTCKNFSVKRKKGATLKKDLSFLLLVAFLMYFFFFFFCCNKKKSSDSFFFNKKTKTKGKKEKKGEERECCFTQHILFSFDFFLFALFLSVFFQKNKTKKGLKNIKIHYIMFIHNMVVFFVCPFFIFWENPNKKTKYHKKSLPF